MQIEPVRAGNQRERFRRVGAKFIRRAGFAGVITRGHEAATERSAVVFKTTHIIALPAVKRDRHFGQRPENFVSIHANCRVTFAGQAVRLLRILLRVHVI